MSEDGAPRAGPLRLLVVEDEALIGMMLEDMLIDLGHDVVDVATSVRQALRLIGARSGEIDAAVVDANLDGQSALPVTEALREAGIAFVLASGYDATGLARLGFDAVCLRKPYQRAEVERTVAHFAKKDGPQAERPCAQGPRGRRRDKVQ